MTNRPWRWNGVGCAPGRLRGCAASLGLLALGCGSDPAAPPAPAALPSAQQLPARATARACFPGLDSGIVEFPRRLVDTGCFDRAGSPAADLIPYQVQSPLWTDGAHKERWFVLPPGQHLGTPDDDELELPEGSLLIKRFSFNLAEDTSAEPRPVETRVMQRLGARWHFATYRHENDAPAELLDDDLTETLTVAVAGGTRELSYLYPSREQCTYCHADTASEVLGFTLGQLNGDYAYPDGANNQISALAGLDIFQTPVAPDEARRLPRPTDTAEPIEARARAYLHANCAHCHQPGGFSSPSLNLDMRFQLSLSQTKLCEEVQFLATPGTKRIAPGDVESSYLHTRMLSSDEERMPPIGTVLVDESGAQLIASWIESKSRCP